MILTWNKARKLAQQGNWERIKEYLNTANPIEREALFGIALQQRCWDHVYALFRQGFGTRRLQELVDIALKEGAWYFLLNAVYFRLPLFKPPLLAAILAAALDQQLWGVVFDLGPGVSPDIDAMIFDRAVSMELDAVENCDRIHVAGLVVHVSLSAKRWSFVFGAYFGERGVKVLNSAEQYRSERPLDATRRRRAFEELLKEFARTRDGYVESLLLSHLHECPGDLRDQFFVFTIRNKLFETAYDIIEKGVRASGKEDSRGRRSRGRQGTPGKAATEAGVDPEKRELDEKKKLMSDAAREGDVMAVVNMMRSLDL